MHKGDSIMTDFDDVRTEIILSSNPHDTAIPLLSYMNTIESTKLTDQLSARAFVLPCARWIGCCEGSE